MKSQAQFLVLILAAITATACKPGARGGPNGGTVYEYEKTPGHLNQGGADTGGGAGAKGRMLENYKVRIHETPEFRSHVQPLIDEIAKTEPAFAADLLHIAMHRQWYIIPTDLGKIPPSDMVAAIAGKDVEQLAVQTEAEVWIDKRAYGPMPALERKELIVHELVMGVRMMEYQNGFDQCLAESVVHLVKNDQKAYRDQKRACSLERLRDAGRDHRITRKQIGLNNTDYNLVRRITIQLLNEGATLSTEELRAMVQIDLRRALHRPTPG